MCIPHESIMCLLSIFNSRLFQLVLIALTALIAPVAMAVELIKAPMIVNRADTGDKFNFEVLQQALAASEDKYGPYRIQLAKQAMVSSRVLDELERGENLSVAISPYKKAWLGKTLVVPFPVNKGLSSYRMFFTRKDLLPALKQVETLEQLRTFRYGQGRGWSTAKILEDHKFKVVYSESFPSFPKMLKANRFDLFMRGSHEIIWEKQALLGDERNLVIAPDIAIYTYLPSYFNVSKHRPKLANRIEAGIQKMNQTGQLDQLLNKYFGEAIDLINHQPRKVFYLDNTNLPPGTYERDKPNLLKVMHSTRPSLGALAP